MAVPRGVVIASFAAGIAALLVAALAAGTGADRRGVAEAAPSPTSLRVGDCVNGLHTAVDLLSLPAVPCDRPHEGEVVAVFALPAGPYPGAGAVDQAVADGCSTRLAAYAPNPAVRDPGLFTVYPLQRNWEQGDREVACIATPGAGGTSTGSIRGR